MEKKNELKTFVWKTSPARAFNGTDEFICSGNGFQAEILAENWEEAILGISKRMALDCIRGIREHYGNIDLRLRVLSVKHENNNLCIVLNSNQGSIVVKYPYSLHEDVDYYYMDTNAFNGLVEKTDREH